MHTKTAFLMFSTVFVRERMPSFSEQCIKNTISIIIGQHKYQNAHKNPDPKTKVKNSKKCVNENEENKFKYNPPKATGTSNLESKVGEDRSSEFDLKHQSSEPTDFYGDPGSDKDISRNQDVSEVMNGKLVSQESVGIDDIENAASDTVSEN